MKRNRKELDSILDRVAAGIRSEEIDVAVVESAADRVWARLSKESASVELPETKAVEEIRGCADFQALIPAYLKKELSDARTLLLEDHTRECIPCRKALKAARSGNAQGVVSMPRAVKTVSRTSAQTPIWKWAIAATLVIGVGLLAFNIYRRISIKASASLQAAQGSVFKVTDKDSVALGVGQGISSGERIRTAKDANAVVRLEDGSLVEMKERSEFSLSQNADGTT
ncbi:MAG TPA: zf-HC2 domain-containing protein, partial [Pyrinomonadaceae bacterium]